MGIFDGPMERHIDDGELLAFRRATDDAYVCVATSQLGHLCGYVLLEGADRVPDIKAMERADTGLPWGATFAGTVTMGIGEGARTWPAVGCDTFHRGCDLDADGLLQELLGCAARCSDAVARLNGVAK